MKRLIIKASANSPGGSRKLCERSDGKSEIQQHREGGNPDLATSDTGRTALKTELIPTEISLSLEGVVGEIGDNHPLWISQP